MKHFCYYNLHKHVFSLKNTKTQKVEHYSESVIMVDCTLKVSEKGRQRVLKEKRKNVHAGVVGQLIGLDLADFNFNLNDFIELTYNPYIYDSFVVKSDKSRVEKASLVILHKKKIYAVGLVLK
jgi:hypothetical protein